MYFLKIMARTNQMNVRNMRNTPSPLPQIEAESHSLQISAM